jgi:DNA repair protein RadC
MVIVISYIDIMAEKILIRDLNTQNKPRERLLDKGSEALSDIELLAILLRSGGSDVSVMDLAGSLLKKYQGLQSLLEADVNQLLKEQHIGQTKATAIKAAAEIAKRAYLNNQKNSVVIKRPEDAFKIIKKDLFGKNQEHLYLLSLDSRKKLISKDLICIGSINETLVPVREIVRKALIKDAVNIILVHNHPSLDPTPSHEDILVTEKVAKACITSGISLLDHLITANNEYMSIKSLGLFESSNLKKERR